MSRRRKAVKRDVMPDPKFSDKIVSKFTSCLMYDGKRSTAEKIVYGAFEVIEKNKLNGNRRLSLRGLVGTELSCIFAG